ncbi:glycosyltransferase family 4 protein [Rhizobium sp. YIM 134829]|uniref:glycosyltransferase family 4 protein n=1 Tax=Rhizobium sp. YIM 134829 TaxID=3390453 RepID=UPI00397A762C
MRTALIAWDYPPSPSGLSTAAREIAESLVLQGCDVTVFTGDRSGTSVSEGVRLIGCEIPRRSRLGRLRTYAALGHLAAPLRFRDAVLAAHVEKPFDVVEATNWYAPGVLLAGRPDLPLVTRNSTPAAWSRESVQSPRNRLDSWAADRLERRQAMGSAALISNTAEHGRRVERLYALEGVAGRDGRAHDTIGLSLASSILERAGKAAYPASVPPFRILFVGRAEPRKGFAELIEAIGLLAPLVEAGQMPDFRLDLLGVPEEDLPAGIAPATRSRLNPLGRQPDGTLFDLYEAAHVVAAPSRYESFGLVYQEAIAFGRPVVASAEDPSARDFIGKTGAGLLAERTDGPSIAHQLRHVLQSGETRGRLRRSALDAAGTFTRATLGQQTVALYRKAIAHTAGSNGHSGGRR